MSSLYTNSKAQLFSVILEILMVVRDDFVTYLKGHASKKKKKAVAVSVKYVKPYIINDLGQCLIWRIWM